MKISILTVCRNSMPHIATAVQSVVAQDYPDREYIVVDGASTDGTTEWLRSHSTGIDLLVSEPDAGMYWAINKALSLATGDVVGLLHADDVLEHPGVLRLIANAFDAHRPDMVYGNLRYVAADALHHQVRYWRAGVFRPKALAWGWMPPHPTVYVRRALVDQYGNYDTRFRIAADYEWMLRYLLAPVRVHYIDQVLVRMRLGGASNKSVANVLHKMSDDWRALRLHGVGHPATLLFKNLRKLPQLWTRALVSQHFTSNG